LTYDVYKQSNMALLVCAVVILNPFPKRESVYWSPS